MFSIMNVIISIGTKLLVVPKVLIVNEVSSNSIVVEPSIGTLISVIKLVKIVRVKEML